MKEKEEGRKNIKCDGEDILIGRKKVSNVMVSEDILWKQKSLY